MKNWLVWFYNVHYKVINEFVIENMTEEQAEKEVNKQIQLFREHVEDFTMEEHIILEHDS